MSRSRILPSATLPLALLALAAVPGPTALRAQGLRWPAPDDAREALASLVAAERAFADLATREGMRTAFLRYFDDDVVTFGPLPVQGTRALEEGPPGPHLEWWPAVAEVSADGTLGYTTGPYRVPGSDGVPAAWGHYHSVWARGADGAWRVVLDIGGPHGPVAPPDSVRRPEAPLAPGTGGAGGDSSAVAWDRAYAEAYGREGRGATSRFGSPRARVYRPGGAPVEGLEGALAEQERAGEELDWDVLGGGGAGSADLAYTWGRGTRRAGPDEAVGSMGYARIWRRHPDGSWRFVVEVVLAGG